MESLPKLQVYPFLPNVYFGSRNYFLPLDLVRLLLIIFISLMALNGYIIERKLLTKLKQNMTNYLLLFLKPSYLGPACLGILHIICIAIKLISLRDDLSLYFQNTYNQDLNLVENAKLV